MKMHTKPSSPERGFMAGLNGPSWMRSFRSEGPRRLAFRTCSRACSNRPRSPAGSRSAMASSCCGVAYGRLSLRRASHVMCRAVRDLCVGVQAGRGPERHPSDGRCCAVRALVGGGGRGASPARVTIRAAGASFLAIVSRQLLLDWVQGLQIGREPSRSSRCWCEKEGRHLHRWSMSSSPTSQPRRYRVDLTTFATN